MKAKHRVLAAGMAAAMTLSLAACGGSASTAEPTAREGLLLHPARNAPQKSAAVQARKVRNFKNNHLAVFLRRFCLPKLPIHEKDIIVLASQ